MTDKWHVADQLIAASRNLAVRVDRCGLTQKEISAATGIEPAYLCRLIRGNTPANKHLAHLNTLAGLFGLEVQIKLKKANTK